MRFSAGSLNLLTNFFFILMSRENGVSDITKLRWDNFTCFKIWSENVLECDSHCDNLYQSEFRKSIFLVAIFVQSCLFVCFDSFSYHKCHPDLEAGSASI